jgi:hypothetical protein
LRVFVFSSSLLEEVMPPAIRAAMSASEPPPRLVMPRVSLENGPSGFLGWRR